MDRCLLLLATLAALFCGVRPAAADQTVRTYYSYAPEDTAWTPDGDGVIGYEGDVAPRQGTANVFEFKSGKTNVFTARPANGWEIDSWYCAPHGRTSKKWLLQEGGESYEWKADNQKDHVGWEDLVLVAVFKPIDYGLSFDANGGSGSMENETHSYTNEFRLTPCAFENAKDNKAFAGWTNETTGATFAEQALVSGEILAVSNDAPSVKLKAVWSNRVYKLTFDANGGTFEDGQTTRTVLAEANMPLGELPLPTCPGMRRDGWWTEESGGSAVDRYTTYTWKGDVTLYEHWQEEIYLTVTVSADPPAGGSATGGGTQFVQGDKTTLQAAANEGYEFERWSDGGAQTHEITVLRSEDYTATFTGKWYSVSFNVMGGSAVEESRDYQYGKKFGSLPTTRREGFEFAGWFRKKTDGALVTEETLFDFSNPDDADYTLYAHWTVRPAYSVSYAGGAGATGSMDVQRIYCGEATALTSNAFTRTGYTFRGWAETNDLATVKYLGGEVVTDIAAANETNGLHAVWSANRYTVAFDGNGATEIEMEPQEFVYDVKQNLRGNTFTRGELWSFGGWSNAVDGAVYADGALVSNLCATADGTNVLKAVWNSTLTDLSRAMHCTNLIWFSQRGTAWQPLSSGGYEQSGSEAWAETEHFIGDTANHTAYLSATGMVRGTLSFYWKADSAGAKLNLYCDHGGIWSQDPLDCEIAQAADTWQHAEFSIPEPTAGKSFLVMKLELSDENTGTGISIDQVTWTPSGTEPQQGEPVMPTAAGVEDGVFSLTIPTASGKSYGVWTNANLLIDSWGLMGEGDEKVKKGDGNPLIFEWTIIPEMPQLFFRAHEVK